jgi:hypothetical protein
MVTPAHDPGRSCGPSRIPAARRSDSYGLCSAGPAPVRHACAIGRSKPHEPNGHDNRNGFGDRSVRQALAGEGRWSWIRFPVATASLALGHGPADAIWLPLRETWPRRRIIDLDCVEHAAGGVPPSSARS